MARFFCCEPCCFIDGSRGGTSPERYQDSFAEIYAAVAALAAASSFLGNTSVIVFAVNDAASRDLTWGAANNPNCLALFAPFSPPSCPTFPRNWKRGVELGAQSIKCPEEGEPTQMLKRKERQR